MRVLRVLPLHKPQTLIVIMVDRGCVKLRHQYNGNDIGPLRK